MLESESIKTNIMYMGAVDRSDQVVSYKVFKRALKLFMLGDLNAYIVQ